MCFIPLLSLILLGNSTEATAVTFGKETVLLKDQPEPITHVAVTDDGKFLFVFDRKGRVRIWDTGKRDWRNLGIIAPEGLALSRSGKHIFSLTVIWSINLKDKYRFPATVA